MKEIIPIERIEKKIYFIREQKVMLDKDLAELYMVQTRQLKRAVRRNLDRFPDDFMLILNEKEINEMVCHFGTPSKSYFGGAKPYAFTEHGILMLSSVLRSKRAIKVNIQIMRTFSKLRKMVSSIEGFRKKLESLEQKYDQQFRIVFDAIKALMLQEEKPKKRIGFLRGKEQE